MHDTSDPQIEIDESQHPMELLELGIFEETYNIYQLEAVVSCGVGNDEVQN